MEQEEYVTVKEASSETPNAIRLSVVYESSSGEDTPKIEVCDLVYVTLLKKLLIARVCFKTTEINIFSRCGDTK